jgi:hypothetical protein
MTAPPLERGGGSQAPLQRPAHSVRSRPAHAHLQNGGYLRGQPAYHLPLGIHQP